MPINCNTDYEPEDCLSLEQGFFEVDGQQCPGCRICIRKGRPNRHSVFRVKLVYIAQNVCLHKLNMLNKCYEKVSGITQYLTILEGLTNNSAIW